jgi:hypothetical protein
VLGNGPAGNHNKILVSGKPDFLGPFFDLYRQWCGRGVKKAIDYGDKKVTYMHTQHVYMDRHRHTQAAGKRG